MIKPQERRLGTMGRILIVDDDQSLRQALSVLLKRKGYEVSVAANGREALETLRSESLDVVITDLKMDEMSGLELLKGIKSNFPEVEVILLTAFGSISNAVEAMKLEAFDYVTKPFKNDELLIVVSKALERRKLVSEVKYLREVLDYRYNFGTIIGQSPAIKKVIDQVMKSSARETPVLISGSTGTGKELVAKALHDKSSRKNGKFIAVNCSGMPGSVLEAELFGNSGRSYVEAPENQVGLLESADGGTVFIDDISDLDLATQSKIVQVLERGIIKPVGSDVARKVNVRVIAATKRDLEGLIRNGTFRADLLRLLSELTISLPNLRDRGDDILLLADHFIKKYAREFGRRSASLTPDAARTLLHHSWPGNVTELENAIKRTVALSDSEKIRTEDLILVTDVSEGPHSLKLRSRTGGGKSLEDKELDYIVSSLRENDWNYTQTAKKLGIGRTTLWRKMKKIKEKERQTVSASSSPAE